MRLVRLAGMGEPHASGAPETGGVANLEQVRMRATMYFRYGNRKRPDVTSDTTFDAILVSERTSTTRFAGWESFDRWKTVKVGDLIRFYEDKAMTGRSLLVRIREISEIDLRSCDAAELEAWSRAEGWKPEEGRSLGMRNGIGLWIRFDLVDPQPRPRPKKQEEPQSQLSLGLAGP